MGWLSSDSLLQFAKLYYLILLPRVYMSINTHRHTHTHGETLGHRAMSWCFSELALLFFLYVVETTQKNGWQSHMISCSVAYPKNSLRSSQPMAGMASPPLHFWPHWGCLPGWILWEQPPWTVDSMVPFCGVKPVRGGTGGAVSESRSSALPPFQVEMGLEKMLWEQK